MQLHNKSPMEQQQINTSNENQQEQDQKGIQMRSKGKQRRTRKQQKKQKDKSVTNSMNEQRRTNKSQAINVQQIDMGPQQLIEDEQDQDFGYQIKKNTLTKKQHQQNSYKPITLLIKLIKFVALSIIVVVAVMFYSRSINQGRQFAKNSTRDVGLRNITVNDDSSNYISGVTNQSKIIQNEDKPSSNLDQRREKRNKMQQQMINNQNEQQDSEQLDQYLSKNYTQYKKDQGLFTDPKYVIKIKSSQFPPFKINNIDISQYGISKDIQIGTIYDYLNITHSKEFQSFKQLWTNRLEQIIPADIYQLPIQQIQQGSKIKTIGSQNSSYTSTLQYSQFKDQQEMNAYLNSLNNWNNQRNYGSDLQLYLSSHIIWNETSSKLKQIQLFLLQKKYNLSKYSEEVPICVFSTGYQIFSRHRHQYFLQSLEKQNYTNFHIIAVDDYSPDQSGPKIFQFLKQTSMRIKSKIKIIRNKQNLGATASTYYWTRKLCNPGQIVVHVDMDDMLLGRQVFKTLNAVYHNKDVWYAYTRYLRQDKPEMLPNAGKSRAMNSNIREYRFLIDWKTSAMRTFRYQIMNNVPIQHLVQYHYDEHKEILHPKFYDTDADRFLIYSQLQLCDNKHVKYLNDVFYYYNVTNNVASKCNMRHQHFDQYKSRIKIPVKPLVTLQDQGAVFVDRQFYSVPQNITQTLRKKYQLYQKCLQQN